MSLNFLNSLIFAIRIFEEKLTWRWRIVSREQCTNTATLVPEFLGKFCDANRFFYFFFIGTKRWEPRKESLWSRPLGSSLSYHQLLTGRRVWLEDIFNCSTSHMIGWIKYLLGCDWSKENDILDSCQVLSQHESEILHDLDQRLSFSPGSALRSALHVANFQIKKKH